MSDTVKNSLRDHLETLQCHFTWNLHGEDVHIVSVEERLNAQISLMRDANKHRQYNLLAYLKYLRGKHDEAMLQIQNAEAEIQKSYPSEDQDFKTTVMYGNYAWLCYHQSQFTMSSNYADKVEAILQKYDSPSMKNTLLLDLYGEQGWAYLSFTGKYYEKAKECFQKALKIDPENPEVNSSYAIAAYRMENLNLHKDPPNASLPVLERALKFNPNDTVVKVLLALKYQDVKNYAEGERLIEQALQEEPESPYVLRYVGKYYKRKGEVKEAIAIFEKAVEITPSSSTLHYQLGSCYNILIAENEKEEKWARLRGQPTDLERQKTEAIASAKYFLEKAVALNKRSVPAYIELAKIYIKDRQYEKAEEAFHKAETMGHITCTEKQELHFSWAQYERFNRKSEAEAIKHYKEVIMIKICTKVRTYAINNLKDLAKIIIDRNSADAGGHDLLCFIHELEEDENRATEHYEKSPSA